MKNKCPERVCYYLCVMQESSRDWTAGPLWIRGRLLLSEFISSPTGGYHDQSGMTTYTAPVKYALFLPGWKRTQLLDNVA